MKKRCFLLLLCAVFLLSGCSFSSENNDSSHADTNLPIIENSGELIASDTAELVIPDTYIEDTRNQYARLYDATHRFSDMYMAEKAWLIGDEKIVQLISIGGFNDATVLIRDNIERIEKASFADFATVSIIDKTGQTLSLMILPEELLVIIELLK